MTDYNKIQAFLYAEARALDDREFDEWIEFYHPDCPYYMPSWDDEDQLTSDPQSELSLIYYANRGGIEDRVFRIKTDHNVHNIEILKDDGTNIELRFNWTTHSYRYRIVDVFFGTSFYSLVRNGDSYLITNKKVILKNDIIRQVMDVYHM
jgi:benzoate/toluate 1,2-dioxygenase beta subunit